MHPPDRRSASFSSLFEKVCRLSLLGGIKPLGYEDAFITQQTRGTRRPSAGLQHLTSPRDQAQEESTHRAGQMGTGYIIK